MKFPRFSLRLLLVAVAVLCAWLAWERNTVTRRRAAIERWQAYGSVRMHTWPQKRHFVQVHGSEQELRGTTAALSWLRRKLGDEAVQSISFGRGWDDPQVMLARRLFPEAIVMPEPPAAVRRGASPLPSASSSR